MIVFFSAIVFLFSSTSQRHVTLRTAGVALLAAAVPGMTSSTGVLSGAGVGANVAVGAAEGLLSSEFSGDVADQLVRSRKRLLGVSVRTFEVEETLDQIDAILARPLGFGESEAAEPD